MKSTTAGDNLLFVGAIIICFITNPVITVLAYFGTGWVMMINAVIRLPEDRRKQFTVRSAAIVIAMAPLLLYHAIIVAIENIFIRKRS